LHTEATVMLIVTSCTVVLWFVLRQRYLVKPLVNHALCYTKAQFRPPLVNLSPWG
jgi:hypothetical protein